MALPHCLPARPLSTTRALHRTASALALAAGSLGLVAVASPASAQCVEGPPNSYSCSGEQTSTQGLAGPTLSISTTPGFTVDTASNGGGPSILAWGTGTVAYVDQNASRLAGGGAHFRTLTGNLNVISNGVIDASTAGDGLFVESLGIGDVGLYWTADIHNAIGVGARVVGSGGDIFATVASVTAQEDALVLTQAGSGRLTLLATGDISSAEGRGVSINSGADSGDMFVDLRSVSGDDGIVIYNGGAGATVVLAETVTADHPFGEGVHVFTGFFSSEVFVEVGNVTGGSYGVNVVSSASQGTIVRAGDVVASGTGVSVVNDDLATDLTLTTGAVTAGFRGIDVTNFGLGDTSVSASGAVSSAAGIGVFAYNETDAGALGLDVTDVTGTTGIYLNNRGSGASVVVASGDIVGTEAIGLEAYNDVGATDLILELQAVSGASGGIFARNLGTGQTSISAAGDVVGNNGDAIRVLHAGTGSLDVLSLGSILALNGIGVAVEAGPDSGFVVIDVNDVSGSETGIVVNNGGTGETIVTARGIVEGGFSAVNLFSSAAQAATLVNEGVIRNRSNASSDLAISATGGAVGIANLGQIRGTINLFATEGLVLNFGGWDSTGGESFFQGDADAVLNAQSGIMVAGSGAATDDVTRLLGLEVFENHGGVTLRDGGASDLLQTSANTTFFGGSTLFVDIGGAGLADRFVTTGTLDIQDGSILGLYSVSPLVLYSQYLVAEASGGLTGEFDFEDVFLTAFAGLRDTYTDTEAFIEFAQLRPLADAGVTPNQKAAAAGADSLPDGSPVKDALLMLPNDDMAIDAFDQLSGEIHPTTRTVLAESSRHPRDAALARLADGDPKGAVWATAWVEETADFGDFNAARAEGDATGLVAGVDRLIGDNLTVGVAAAWSDTDLEIARRGSHAEVKTVQGLVYAGGRFGSWAVRGGVGYAKSSVETERSVSFPGFAAALEADYDASVLQGFVDAGYRMPAAGGYAEPFVNLTALRIETDGFVETAGPAALAGEASEDDVLMSTLGVRFETNRMGAFSLRGAAGWRHAWGDLEPAGVHTFDGGAPFTVLGAAHSNDAAVANVEAQWRLRPNMSVGLAVDTVLGSDNSAHGITAGLKVVF